MQIPPVFYRTSSPFGAKALHTQNATFDKSLSRARVPEILPLGDWFPFLVYLCVCMRVSFLFCQAVSLLRGLNADPFVWKRDDQSGQVISETMDEDCLLYVVMVCASALFWKEWGWGMVGNACSSVLLPISLWSLSSSWKD